MTILLYLSTVYIFPAIRGTQKFSTRYRSIAFNIILIAYSLCHPNRSFFSCVETEWVVEKRRFYYYVLSKPDLKIPGVFI